MDVLSLSKNLKEMRTGLGLSLSQLASRIDTSASTLSRYESGWERFEIYTLNKIATALGYRLRIDFEPVSQIHVSKGIYEIIKRLQRLFWDHKLKKRDFTRYPLWITERVIEYGSLEDVHSLIVIMGKRVFLGYVANSRFQSAKTENFWKSILDKEGVVCTKRSFPRAARIY